MANKFAVIPGDILGEVWSLTDKGAGFTVTGTSVANKTITVAENASALADGDRIALDADGTVYTVASTTGSGPTVITCDEAISADGLTGELFLICANPTVGDTAWLVPGGGHNSLNGIFTCGTLYCGPLSGGYGETYLDLNGDSGIHANVKALEGIRFRDQGLTIDGDAETAAGQAWVTTYNVTITGDLVCGDGDTYATGLTNTGLLTVGGDILATSDPSGSHDGLNNSGTIICAGGITGSGGGAGVINTGLISGAVTGTGLGDAGICNGGTGIITGDVTGIGDDDGGVVGINNNSTALIIAHIVAATGDPPIQLDSGGVYTGQWIIGDAVNNYVPKTSVAAAYYVLQGTPRWTGATGGDVGTMVAFQSHIHVAKTSVAAAPNVRQGTPRWTGATGGDVGTMAVPDILGAGML